jgi:hypothetical protein
MFSCEPSPLLELVIGNSAFDSTHHISSRSAKGSIATSTKKHTAETQRGRRSQPNWIFARTVACNETLDLNERPTALGCQPSAVSSQLLIGATGIFLTSVTLSSGAE